ncbi:MAG: hypothetical protein ABI217_09155, partial [Chthoniobacterales bacterium]
AQVGQIRLAIPIAFCQSGQLRQMVVAVKGKSEQLLRDHFQDNRDAAEMEGRFRQDRFAGQLRLGHLFGDTHGPAMVSVAGIGESDEKSSVGDAFHCFAKPFRVERSAGPFLIVPARRMNFLDA